MVVAGFWQHGDITAPTLFSWLDAVLDFPQSVPKDWKLVSEEGDRHLCRDEVVVVDEGVYIVSVPGTSLIIFLSSTITITTERNIKMDAGSPSNLLRKSTIREYFLESEHQKHFR